MPKFITKKCSKCGAIIADRQPTEKVRLGKPLVKCPNCGQWHRDEQFKEYIMLSSQELSKLQYGDIFKLAISSLIIGALICIMTENTTPEAIIKYSAIIFGVIFLLFQYNFSKEKDNSINRTKDILYLNLLLDYKLINKDTYNEQVKKYNLKK